MTKSKLCCRIFPIVIIIISFIISAAIWYYEEGVHDFAFLTNFGEFINYLGTTLFVAVIPIGIFYILNDKKKWQSKAKGISLLGFLPALIFLLILIF